MVDFQLQVAGKETPWRTKKKKIIPDATVVEPAWLWYSFPEVRNRKETESGLVQQCQCYYCKNPGNIVLVFNLFDKCADVYLLVTTTTCKESDLVQQFAKKNVTPYNNLQQSFLLQMCQSSFISIIWQVCRRGFVGRYNNLQREWSSTTICKKHHPIKQFAKKYSSTSICKKIWSGKTAWFAGRWEKDNILFFCSFILFWHSTIV